MNGHLRNWGGDHSGDSLLFRNHFPLQVTDISQKLSMLEEVHQSSDTHTSRLKEENAALRERLHALEEQMHSVEER